MEDLQRLYPIGIQTFSKIREGITSILIKRNMFTG